MLYKTFGAQFKAVDEGQGVFEALVAVFNNVDRGGDRILPGAFEATLQTWSQKGRPIPVIYSHEWDNLDAHIGQVLEASETDEGLLVKGQLEMDEPFANRVYKKMTNGTLAEFSFAYDIVKSTPVSDDDRIEPNHYQDLEQLDLLEVGPCLVGMNPDTQLITIKNALASIKADADTAGKEAEALQAIHDLAVSLGAKCVGADDSGGDDQDDDSDEGEAANGGKSSDPASKTLAARVAIELIESGIDDTGV